MLAAIGVVLCLGAQGWALASPSLLPAPSDLREEAKLIRQDNRPLIVLFSLPDCGYCKEVRENYLQPLVRDVPEAERALIREVDISSNAPLNGFNGEALTQAQFASRYKVKMAPTVIMLDETGVPLADPLVGAGMAGFYGAYLDNALAKSKQALMLHHGTMSGKR